MVADNEAFECFPVRHVDVEGLTVAVVVPCFGATVTAFSFQASTWAWPLPVIEAVDCASLLTRPTSYGMPILGPTPGRVGVNQCGCFGYRGKEYSITPTRHGFLRNVKWHVRDHGVNTITCTVAVNPGDIARSNDAFPYEFIAEHRIKVGPCTLTSTITLSNPSAIIQPINVGWHPYLHRGGACRVFIPADGRWELDSAAEPIPTGRIIPVGDHDDFRNGRCLDIGDHWDDIFTDLRYEADGISCWVEEQTPVALSGGAEALVRVRRSVSGDSLSVRHLQLYTPAGRPAIALEPFTAPPDALNLLHRGHARADVCELEPGAVAEFSITLSIDIFS